MKFATVFFSEWVHRCPVADVLKRFIVKKKNDCVCDGVKGKKINFEKLKKGKGLSVVKLPFVFAFERAQRLNIFPILGFCCGVVFIDIVF